MHTSTYLISTLPPCQKKKKKKNAPPVTSTPFWKLCDLLHPNNQRHSNFKDCSAQDFNLSWQSILRQIFRPFMTGSNNSGEDHAAGTLASPSLLLLYKSLPAQASSIFHEERLTVFLLYSMRHSFNHSMYFMLPNSTWSLLKINLLAFYALWGYFYIFLTGTSQLLETKWVFYSKSWYWCSWQRCSSRVPTDHQLPDSSTNVSYFWSSFIG